MSINACILPLVKTEPIADRKLVTITDVAHAADVSPSTVSRVLTGSHRVRPAPERRVIEAVSLLGYTPNAAARALRRNRSMTLGVVFPNLDTPHQLSILKGLEAAAGADGYSVLVTSAQGSQDRYERLMQRLFEARVDGLFVAVPIGLKSALDPYTRAGIPVLALYTKDETVTDLPLVTASEDHAIKLAISRALDLGHRSFAQLASRVEVDYSSRVSEVEQTLRRSGIRDVKHLVEVVESTEASAVGDALTRLLSSPRRPTLLLCRDLYLEAILPELRRMGLDLPGDISLISFSDSRWTRWISPPISAISVDCDDIGHTAARAMLDWLSGNPPEPVILSKPAEWMERESLGPAPVK